jgi:hypothetical protein
MPIETLTQLRYSEDRQGPWRLYIYEPNSQYHRGGQWFRNRPQYPDEEITTERAHSLATEAFAAGREVRICDGGDMLVFHAKGNAVLYGATFWEDITRSK